MPAPSPRPAPAFGDHDFVRHIAVGGMGSVFEVRDRRTGARYAAKTIQRVGDATARARFRQEAELLARCDRHPGIVKVHAAGETPEGSPFIILDLVEGEDLEARLARGPLAPRAAAELARDVARALAFVHTLGIVHRDVKPSNVILDAGAGGAPKLTDFGLATARDVERLTQTGQFVGTPFYCSPEQAAGRSVGPGADVFSLGCVLFQALCGETPIPAQSALDLLGKLSRPEPVRGVREVNPGVPGALAQIVARALEKDPERRYPEGGELAQDLDRFLAGAPVSAVARGAASRRSRRTALLGAVVAALGLSATVGGVVGFRRVQARDERVARVVSDLDLARAFVERARRDGAAAVASSEPLAGARAHSAAAAAISAAELLAAEGIGNGSLLQTAREVSGELASVDAASFLATASPERALAVLEATPGGVAALGPEGRLLHVRALIGIGRGAQAAREAEALGPVLAAAHKGEAAELAGDAWLAAGSARESAAAYEAAIRLGRRGADVRAKHASAAARAGDEETAASELATLAPQLLVLEAARGPSPLMTSLAPLAPLLYRRGLASGPTASRTRDLDLAWRLAPPPPELSADVVRFWVDLCRDGSSFESQLTTGQFFSPEEVVPLHHLLERMRRARSLDPACDVSPLWSRLALMRVWLEGGTDERVLAKVSADLLEAWPEHPSILYARARALALSEPQRALDDLWSAARALPAFGQHEEVRALAVSITVHLMKQDDRLGTPPSTDYGAIERVALLSDDPSLMALVSERCRGFGYLAVARTAIDAGASMHSPPGRGLEKIKYDVEALALLMAEHKTDAAIAWVLARHDLTASQIVTSGLVHELVRGDRPQDIVNVLEAGEVLEPLSRKSATDLHRAYLKLERGDDALAFEERIVKAQPLLVETLRKERQAADERMLIQLQGAGTTRADEGLRLARRHHKEVASVASFRLLVRALFERGKAGHRDDLEEIFTLVDPALVTDFGPARDAAKALLALGRLDDAEAFGKKVEPRLPAVAALVRVGVLEKRNRPDEAIAIARDFHARTHDGFSLDLVLRELALHERDRGRSSPAAEIVSLFEATPERRVESRLIYGRALVHVGRFEDAGKEADALESQGNKPTADDLRKGAFADGALGIADLFAQGQPTGAIARARALHESRFKSSSTLALLVSLLLDEIHAYEEVVQLVDPARVTDEESLRDLGLALAQLHRPSEARDVANRIRSRFPDSAARIDIVALLASGDKIQALAQAREQHRQSPGLPSLRTLFLALEASASWDEIIRLQSEGKDDPEIVYRVGCAFLEEKRFEDALACLARIDGSRSPAVSRLRARIEVALRVEPAKSGH